MPVAVGWLPDKHLKAVSDVTAVCKLLDREYDGRRMNAHIREEAKMEVKSPPGVNQKAKWNPLVENTCGDRKFVKFAHDQYQKVLVKTRSWYLSTTTITHHESHSPTT
jgi:hypothetical protein